MEEPFVAFRTKFESTRNPSIYDAITMLRSLFEGNARHVTLVQLNV
jgi:hypothetical protein